METTGPDTWTYAPPAPEAVRAAPGNRFLTALGVLLLAYVLMGRGAAYVGVPPLFIGEIVLAAGLAVVVLARRTPRLVPTAAMGGLALLIVWIGVLVVGAVPGYGLDAVRDGMIVGYGLFAFVVAGLVLERPERLRTLLVRYRILAAALLTLGWGFYLVVRMVPGTFPPVPWAPEVEIIETKPGDLLVHFAAVTAFFILGWKRATPVWLALLVVGASVLMVSNRGGMVAFFAAMALFAALKPQTARFGRLAYAGVLFVVLALAVDTSEIEINEGTRSVSVEQVWENVESVFGRSDSRMLNATAEWRLQWWRQIVGYTFGGDHFLSGKGFGLNLATADGFRVDREESLRSPHNGHLTILARGGVPLFLMWVLVQGLWLWEVVRARNRAARAGQRAWVGFFALVAAFWVAAHVNASFDVYLEGPMGGIWFWTVFGLGMAGARLQRTHPHLLDGLRERAPVAPEQRRFEWSVPR